MAPVSTVPSAFARIAEIESRFAPAAASASGTATATDASATGGDSGFGSVLQSVLGTQGAGGYSILGSGDDSSGSDSSGLGALGGGLDLSSLSGLSGAAGVSSGIDLRKLAAALRGAQLGPGALDGVEASGARSSIPGSPTGDQVIDSAKKYLGIPYLWGGTDPAKGLDCSGFVQRAYADLGVQLPRVSRQQATAGTPVASLEQAKPGDLVAFGSPVDHIAIYMGDGKIIQSPHTGDVVKISAIKRPITAIRRVLPDGPTRATAGAAAGAAAGTFADAAGMATIGPSTGIAGAEPYEQLFQQAGAKYGLNPRLLAAVAKTESNFNPNSVSGVGAQGLMQFMPATAKGMGIDPKDPAQAIDGAGRYLRGQLDRFGSMDLALAAYNAGAGAVRRFGGVPPYAETQGYVRKITNLMAGQPARMGASS